MFWLWTWFWFWWTQRRRSVVQQDGAVVQAAEITLARQPIDSAALWLRVREAHQRRRQPYVVHVACAECDTQGCWLDDYAVGWLAEHDRPARSR